MLAEAHEILETERCPKCRLPKYICQNTSNDITFHVDETICYATAVVEEHDRRDQESRKRKDGSYDDPTPGKFVFPLPRSLSGVDLGTFRGPYYDEQADIRRLLEEDWAASRRPVSPE